MSVTVKARLLWVLPLVMVGSWMAVRTLAASPALLVSSRAGSARVVVAAAAPQVSDPALARLINRFAAAARNQ